ncbi:MAG: heavy metal translocating P-type ATPase [Pseudomonadota bacterium]
MDFRIVHASPGRVRLRYAGGFSARTEKRHLAAIEALGLGEHITVVSINKLTGGILIYFSCADALARVFAVLGVINEMPKPSAMAARLASVAHRFPAIPEEVSADQGLKDVGIRAFKVFFIHPIFPMWARIIGTTITALPYIKAGIASLFRGKLGVEVLDAVAICISILRRDFPTVRTLTLLLSLGEALEEWTRKKSLASLADSLALNVDNVWIKHDGTEVQIPLSQVQEGDHIVVRAGLAIPVDGTIVEGEASVNQASMTGEALGVLRAVGSSVFAGTVVEDGEIVVEVSSVGQGTRLQRIVDYIEQSESVKASLQGRAERLADAAVPFSFLLAGLVWLVTRDPARTASVLMVDYSCALRLATPLAILSAMREAANGGVLIKGGRFLEGLADADTIVLDKTGTLTKSCPHVVQVIGSEDFSEDEVLRLAACLEEHFPHPVARAVVRKAEERGLMHQEEHTEVEYVVAHGVASRLKDKRVLFGSRHYVNHDEGVPFDDALELKAEELAQKGYSLLYLAVDVKIVGIVAIEDPIRPESHAFLQELRANGIDRVIMLTGDDARTAKAVAQTLGITEYHAQLLPTDKASMVQKLRDEGRTVIMMGDGINDSPALSAADVGVSLCEGADLAREVADVVLLEDDLWKLIVAMRMGKRSLKRIKTGYGIIMTLNSLFLLGGLTGLLQPALSAMLHNVTTVGVSLNAMRSYKVLEDDNHNSVIPQLEA